ncbi:MFS transporter [Dictyobacter aurantiacus]|uniref:MFS transporter n=1 Tax=Dictyobacter aurantiacus TaxID=1936993 RepID=A0A401ZJL4_9CHLR|nr:MFS transporter [Dictyobacter aurantiacus]GCE07014.1 MFS transporter [Dictyobacter aurantiacus]
MKYLSRREDRPRLLTVRLAVVAFFFLNGVMTASLSARLPGIQMKLALPAGQLGLALLGCTVGSLIAMNAAGRGTRYIDSRIITTLAALLMAGSLPLMAWAPTLPLLVLALILFGAGSGAMDVGMNLLGVEVERAHGRPIMNSFHACFSVGSLVGALLSSMLAALRVDPGTHFLAIALVTGVGFVGGARFLPSMTPVRGASKKRSLRLSPTLIGMGTIAFCALLSVGALFDWSAIYLTGTLHADAGLAAAGFATFLVCMAMGRMAGDALTTRIGAVALARSACLLAAGGLALALLSTWTPAAFPGLALVGVGLSVPLPLVMSAAGRISAARSGDTLTAVTTWGYAGLLAGPTIIGFIADHLGLRLALALVVMLCLLASLCAPALRPQRPHESQETP